VQAMILFMSQSDLTLVKSETCLKLFRRVSCVAIIRIPIEIYHCVLDRFLKKES
jgi:hypothetical protein